MPLMEVLYMLGVDYMLGNTAVIDSGLPQDNHLYGTKENFRQLPTQRFGRLRRSPETMPWFSASAKTVYFSTSSH